MKMVSLAYLCCVLNLLAVPIHKHLQYLTMCPAYRRAGTDVGEILQATQRLAHAQSERQATACRLLPPMHWALLYTIGALFVSTFILFETGGSFSNEGRHILFTVLCGLMSFVLCVRFFFNFPCSFSLRTSSHPWCLKLRFLPIPAGPERPCGSCRRGLQRNSFAGDASCLPQQRAGEASQAARSARQPQSRLSVLH